MIVLLSAQALPSRAEGPVSPPLLEFAAGLAGNQVRLTWNSEPDTVYRIERSSTLAAGGTGGWAQVALVEATAAETSWVDPEATTTKNFYRITQPVAEVSSITPAVISTTGGELVIDGQGIPAGSFLVLEFDGQTLQVALAPAGGGMWDASVIGQFLEDSSVIATGIVDSAGTTIVSLNVPITVTATGRALDGPPTLPPGAPMVMEAVKPIANIGIVVKKNPGHASERMAGGGKVSMQDFHFAATDSWSWGVSTGHYGGHSAYAAKSKGGPKLATYDIKTTKASRMANPGSSGQDGEPGMQDAVKPIKGIGIVVKKPHTGPYQGDRSSGTAPSGLPGEVSFSVSALSLACPAGPNPDLACTYRSMVPVSSGLGSGWDFSYNIYIEPLPAGAGETATSVAIRDGQGRRDIFHLQPDGSFTCPGMFREGRFDGKTFTLTFANTGKWVFKPLGDRSAPGKIAEIRDPNGNSLTCDYNGTGQLASVSSSFGQSISLAYAGDRISSVTDQTGRSVSFSYYGANDPGGSEGDLRSISCPQELNQPPAAGPVTFTYSTGNPDPRLNRNLLTAIDGAGRLLGAFTYSEETNPLHIDYDSCASAERFKTGHISLIKRQLRPDGGYTVIEVDEDGRVEERRIDRLHRMIACRQYTGFSTPNVPVTPTENRPTGKLRPTTDPDYFETTYSYNSDSQCTRITHPDGSEVSTTYDRDFRKICPPLEAGNPRVKILRTPLGEVRTVTCDYLAGFGSLEGNGQGGISAKTVSGPVIKGDPGSALVITNTSKIASPDGGITAMDDWESPVVRTVNAYGQVETRSYDLKGNLLSVTSPVPGRGSLYEYNALGQPTSATTLNGPGSSFTDTCTYDPATSFLSSVVCDSGGLNLTTACDRDSLGRVIRVVDPRGNDQLYSYNALDQIVEIQSAPVPERVATSLHFDAAGQLARCDVQHRDSSGVLVSANPAYSSFLVYDNHGLLVRTAEEERPVDGSGTLDPATLGIENFAVCDITLNNAGECVRLSTPAACRAQADDLVCDFSYDERGMLHRTYEGGTTNPEGLLTECDYDLYGAMTRCAVSGQGITTVESCSYDGFHRLASKTDPMDNVCTYEYDNKGYVICSVFGEVNDVPGPANNVLLSRTTSRASEVDAYQRLRISSSPGGAMPHVRSSIEGGFIGLLLPSVKREIGPILHGSGPGAGPHVRSSILIGLLLPSVKREMAPILHGSGPGAGPHVRLLLPAVQKLRDSAARTVIGGQGGGPKVNNFFSFETEDETITEDRFTPGSPTTQEITTIDRSPAGLVQQISRNGDLLETCSYDSAGRLTGHVCGDTSHFFTLNPNGDLVSCARTDTCPSDAAQTKTFTISHVIDAAGRCVQTTDGIGNISTCAYDSLHRSVSITEPGGLVTRCAYDGSSVAGPFTEEISADAVTPGTFVVLSRCLVRSGEPRNTSDSYGHTTAFRADALGRMTRCDYPDGTFETCGYTHVNLGPIKHVDHGRTTMTYDLNGRPLTSLTTSDPLVAPVSSTPLKTFTHDGLGRMTSASQGVHIVACSYDSLGNVLSEIQDGRTVSSTYNHRGRTRVSYPNGVAFLENRDVLGQLLTVTADARAPNRAPVGVTHEYHRAGRRVIRSVPGDGLVTTYQYRGDGEAALPGGADFSFDACVKVNVSDLSITIHRRDRNQRDRRFELSFAAGDDAPLRSKTYTRDRLGRVTVCTNRSRTSTGGQILITGEVSYTLDLEGRRLSATGGENPGIYEQLAALPPGDQQMGQYSSWPRGPLEWDDNGNLISMATAFGTLSLVHDVEGRLISASRAGIPKITYDYDPLGRCISRDPETGPATTFVYDGDACVQELGDDGLPDLTHVLCDSVRQSVFTGDDTLFYPHGGINHWGDRAEARNKVEHSGDPHENLNGRMSLLTTSAGSIVERYDCDDAGKPAFLNPAGLTTGAAEPVGPIKWMAPEAIRRTWEPEIGMFQGPGGFYSPDLGMGVSSHKIKPEEIKSKPKQYVGHITLIKQ